MASSCSPKDFYALCTQTDPSRAIKTLNEIPLSNRTPLVSFREAFHEQTPLHAAARAGHSDLVKLLINSKSEIDTRKKDGSTPLSLASYEGHHTVVELLLVAGADKNAPNTNGVTPLSVASSCGHPAVVELLLAAGADKNAVDNNGWTPLFIASQAGHHAVVEVLLAVGADKNAADKDGATPLYIASSRGHHTVVELLLAARADKNTADKDGWTPLYVASQRGLHAVVKLLLAAGADKNATTNGGSTPLMIAKSTNRLSMVQLLSSPLPPSLLEQYTLRQTQLVEHLRQLTTTCQLKSFSSSSQPSSSSSTPSTSTLTPLTPAPQPTVVPSISTAAERLKALEEQLEQEKRARLKAEAEKKLAEQRAIEAASLTNLLKASFHTNFEIPPDQVTTSKFIAKGAAGSVFSGTYHETPVAIKVLQESDLEIEKEVKTWCQFRHPNIVQLIGFCPPPQPMIVMELMQVTLYQVLHDPPEEKDPYPSFEQRFRIACCIASGLSYIHHTRSAVHRDIKSLNILLKGGFQDNNIAFEVKIADFGATRGMHTMKNTLTVVRTNRYAAPELYAVGAQATFASDIFAFAMVLYELLMRRLPFHDHETEPQLLKSLLVDKKRPEIVITELADASQQMVERWITLIQECWDEKVVKRPSAREVLARLSTTPAVPSEYELYNDFEFADHFDFTASSSTSPFIAPASPSSSSSYAFVQIEGEWTVRKWLASLNLLQYADVFEENTETLEDVKALTMEDLKTELQISNLSHRKKLLEYAMKL